jgi:hypothetical protein
MPGAQCTRGLACESSGWNAREYQRGHRNHPAFPHAMALRLIRDLPGDRAFLSPSPRGNWSSAPGWARATSARLDAGIEASGPHDFAVRISAVRLACLSSLTGLKPALRFLTCSTLPRPPHPAPTFVTMANAPLSEQGEFDIG